MKTTNLVAACGLLAILLGTAMAVAAPRVQDDLKELDIQHGIVVLLGMPTGDAAQVTRLAEAGELTIYFQSADSEQANAVRASAESAGLLGRRRRAGP